MVNMIPVSSNNLTAVGYDTLSNTLYVSFKGGSTYAYFDVPVNVYNQLMKAPSHGRFLASNIKGYYNYRKL